MVREINRAQLLAKTSRFLEATNGTPAPDFLILIEVGPQEHFARVHIPRAIHIAYEKFLIGDPTAALGNMAADIVLYGERSQLQDVKAAAELLNRYGHNNVYVYSGGKEDWITNGMWVESSLVPADHFQVGNEVPEYAEPRALPLLKKEPKKEEQKRAA